MLLNRTRFLANQLHRTLNYGNVVMKANPSVLQKPSIEYYFKRNYKKFGHRTQEFPLISKVFHLIIGSLIVFSMLNHEA